jgi:hypothetical protein
MLQCDQRRPTCLNCSKSRQYVCDGYGIAPAPGTDQTAARLAVESNTKDSNAPAQAIREPSDVSKQNPNSLNNMTWPAEEVMPFGGGLDQMDDSDWMGAFSTPSVSDRNAFLQTLSNIFPEGMTGFTFPAQPTETSSYSSQSSSKTNARDVSPGPVLIQGAKFPELSQRPLASALRPSPPSIFDVAKSPSPVVSALGPVEFAQFSPDIRQLLSHYRTHVCQLMMPTAAPSHNPWLQIYLRIALQEPRTPARQGLLHSILAVSAFNQAGLQRNNRPWFRKQALEHSRQAERIISSFDYEYTSPAQLEEDKINKQALLATALTMTTIEVSNLPFKESCHS